jgi:hypothetical protein
VFAVKRLCSTEHIHTKTIGSYVRPFSSSEKEVNSSITTHNFTTGIVATNCYSIKSSKFLALYLISLPRFPVHILTLYFLLIHLNIILPSESTSPKCRFPSGFVTKILYTFIVSAVSATCPVHLISLVYIP